MPASELGPVSPGGELGSERSPDAHQLEALAQSRESQLPRGHPCSDQAEEPFAVLHHLPALLERREVPAAALPADHPQAALGRIEREAATDGEGFHDLVAAEVAGAEGAVGPHRFSGAGGRLPFPSGPGVSSAISGGIGCARRLAMAGQGDRHDPETYRCRDAEHRNQTLDREQIPTAREQERDPGAEQDPGCVEQRQAWCGQTPGPLPFSGNGPLRASGIHSASPSAGGSLPSPASSWPTQGA
jgi:hypothetical protein